MDFALGEAIRINKTSMRIEECIADEGQVKYFHVKDPEEKSFMLKIFRNPSKASQFQQELQNFKAVGLHGKLLHFYDFLEEVNFSIILLEYTARFTLQTLLTSSASLNDCQTITVARDVLLALHHIHSKKLVHTNITPKSVFVTHDYKFKLGDFAGICLESSLKSKVFTLPQEYQAPELLVLSETMPLTCAIDIWAIGCLIFKLLYFTDAFSPNDVESQMRGKYKKTEVQANNCWKIILNRMLDPNPYTRATIQEIITLLHEGYMPKMITTESVEYLRPSSMFKTSSSSWVKAITAENDKIPDAIFTSKLIGKAWNKPFKIPKFFQSLLQRPFTKAVVALKCLIIILKYTSLGPKCTCEGEMGGIGFIEEMEKYWLFSSKPKKDKTNSEEILGVIRTSITALKSKLRFHLLTKTHGDWHDLSVIDVETISAVLKFWDESIAATKALLGNPEVYNQLREHLSGIFIDGQQRIMIELAAILQKNPDTPYNEFFQNNTSETLSLIQRYKSCFPYTTMVRLYSSEPMVPKSLSISSPKSIAKTDAKSTKSESKFGEKSFSKRGSIILTENPTWTLNMSELDLKQSVGVGSSCTVYKGTYRHTPVAIKVLRNNSQSTEKEFEREVEAMVKLRHPNLVLFMGASFEKELCIVTEFCFGDTVFSLLHEKHSVQISLKQQLKMAKDTAQGMAFLHSSNVIHRDLKSLNLLLEEPVTSPNDRVHVKITDFGISRNVGDEVMTGQMGTCHWMAPEVLASENYGFPADVYSYAIVIWEIFARETPYRGINPAMIPYQVLHLALRPDINKVTYEPIKQLILRMWVREPENRPTFPEILTFFNNL